jgi:ATP-binding cassette, subfamily B, bacterial
MLKNNSEALKLPTSLWKFLFHFIYKHKIQFTILTFSMCCWSLEEACYPYFMKLIIDKIATHQGPLDGLFDALSATLIMAGGVIIFIEINYRIFDFLSAKLYPQYMADIRSFIYEYAIGHSFNFFANNFTGNIASKISRLPESAHRIIDLFITVFFPFTLSVLLSSLFLALTKPVFAIALLSWFFLYIGITLSFIKYSSNLSSSHSKILNELNGKITDNLSNINNIKLFAHHRYEKKLFFQHQELERKSFNHAMKFNAYVKFLLSFVTVSFVFISVSLSIYCYSKSLITIGDLSMIFSYQGLVSLVWYIGMEMVPFFDLIGICRESLSILNTPHGLQDIAGAKDLVVRRGEIKFVNVSFKYTKNQALIQNQSLVIKPLEKVGLIGLSGSGKSTFMNLILRCFDVDSGQILIDDQDIAQVKQESLRNNISLIPQESLLFHRSIMDNIRYGKPNASDVEVIEAAKLAEAHDFIMRLPQQYHTLVGERGNKISGGQKQRIAISRAMLKNAPILILDEATSALDAITERQIQQSFAKLMHDKTVLVIAHRLFTLLNMDRILVFSQGAIIEDGTHAQLMQDPSSHYAKLWAMQSAH